MIVHYFLLIQDDDKADDLIWENIVRLLRIYIGLTSVEYRSEPYIFSAS